MRIYDLFSGIGGFSEAARRVGWSTAGYCDFDKNAVKIYNIDTLRELGYVGQYQVLNSKYFGVPQNRGRVFILGFRGKSGPQIFPLGADVQEVDELQRQNCNTLTARYEGAQATGTYIIENQLNAQGEQKIMPIGNIYPSKHEAGNVYDSSGISPTLKCNGPRPNANNQAPKIMVIDAYNSSVVDTPGAVRQNIGNGGPLIMLNSATKDGFSIAEEGDGIRLQFASSKSARGRVVKGASQTLQTSGAGGVIQNQKIRRLTPLECERLQNYRDGWTEGVSDSQRYRLLGNSITVSVAEAIFREVQKCI